MEPLKSSECSSSYSSVEENEPEVFFRLHDNVPQPENFLLSNLSTCYTTESTLENSFEIERSCSQILFQNNHRRMVPFFPLSNQAYEDEKLIQIPVPIQSGNMRSAKMSDSAHEGYHSGRCWPLGGLSINPFYNCMNYMGPKEPHCTESSLQMTDGNTETPEREESVFSEVSIPFNSRSDADKKVEFMNGRYGHLSLHIHKLWNSRDYYDLSTNPMVTKAAWLRKANNLRNGILTKNEGSYLPYFDFSSVIVPCKASTGSMFSCSGHGFQVEPLVVSSGVSAVQVSGNSEGNMQDSMANVSVSSPVSSLSEENHISGILSHSTFGGAAWVQSLQYSGEDTMLSSRKTLDSSAVFEMPLFVTIDKCILQEILHQYPYD